MTMILNCQLCGGRFYANTEHVCPKTDSRIVELLEKILDRLPEREDAEDEPETCRTCGQALIVTGTIDCLTCFLAHQRDAKAAPADDLPGEPTHDCTGEGCWWCDRHTSDGRCKYPKSCAKSGHAADGLPGEDDDPDEALAKVIYAAEGESDDGEWGDLYESVQDDFLRMARAAREHIYAEPDQSWVTRDIEEAEERYRVERERADKAEKALDAESLARICQKERAEHAEAKRDEWKERAEKAEAERDDAISERDLAIEQRDFARSTRDEWMARAIKAERS